MKSLLFCSFSKNNSLYFAITVLFMKVKKQYNIIVKGSVICETKITSKVAT